MSNVHNTRRHSIILFPLWFSYVTICKHTDVLGKLRYIFELWMYVNINNTRYIAHENDCSGKVGFREFCWYINFMGRVMKHGAVNWERPLDITMLQVSFPLPAFILWDPVSMFILPGTVPECGNWNLCQHVGTVSACTHTVPTFQMLPWYMTQKYNLLSVCTCYWKEKNKHTSHSRCSVLNFS